MKKKRKTVQPNDRAIHVDKAARGKLVSRYLSIVLKKGVQYPALKNAHDRPLEGENVSR